MVNLWKMQSSFTDYPQKCTVCGNLKTFPYTFNSTLPPVMCTCPKPVNLLGTLAWECPRCKKINAPWKGSCDCTPTPFGAPTSTTQSYDSGNIEFPHYYQDLNSDYR